MYTMMACGDVTVTVGGMQICPMDRSLMHKQGNIIAETLFLSYVSRKQEILFPRELYL
jgi:hypothetical protein